MVKRWEGLIFEGYGTCTCSSCLARSENKIQHSSLHVSHLLSSTSATLVVMDSETLSKPCLPSSTNSFKLRSSRARRTASSWLLTLGSCKILQRIYYHKHIQGTTLYALSNYTSWNLIQEINIGRSIQASPDPPQLPQYM